jgi:SagB-type dehydrogenase family enzyme
MLAAMSKLAWVLLPLLAVVVALALAAWRGRLPSRLALNVGFSLLLLVYLAATAGLGIFWVANQHLPVFDWHYLFGYATVLLLVVHLAFNGRVVWRFLTQRRPGAVMPGTARPAAPDPRRGRLSLLGALGAGAALAGAYALGLRHGRTELRIDADAGSSGSGVPAGQGLTHHQAQAIVETFHEFSSHSRAGVFRRAASVDWGEAPPPFKTYPGAPVIVLPPPAGTAPADPGWRWDLSAVSTLLWHAAGVNLRRGPIHFRTAPSSGALFAAEFYVVARGLGAAGLEDGLWHYDGLRHRLHRLPMNGADAPGDFAPWGLAPTGDACVIATAVWRRSGHKYGDRCYRYVLADLGHGLENLRLAAAALGGSLAWRPVFDEARVAARLGLDEAVEAPLAWLVVGPPAAMASPAEETPAGWGLAPREAGGALGVTDAIHRATSLRAPATSGVASGAARRVPGAVAPRRAADAAPAPVEAASGVVVLPRAVASTMPALQRIGQRRSIRRYAAVPVPLPVLAALLDAMAVRHGPWISTAVVIHVVAQAVGGLPIGAWRFDPAARRLLLSRSLDPGTVRSLSRRAGLDQDVIGDAAAVLVLTIDRRALVADPAGSARGYRHAFLEAGVVGERAYLEATALGLGVCGVGAFYDDEASQLISVDPAREWVVHFASVGALG